MSGSYSSVDWVLSYFHCVNIYLFYHCVFGVFFVYLLYRFEHGVDADLTLSKPARTYFPSVL